MKAGKLREMTKEEIEQQHTDVQAELFNLHVRKGVRQLEQPSRLRTLRRDLARIKTIMKERERSVR